MANPVEFALALSSSYPSGTGSYTYEGKFYIVVQNLAYDKKVSIWTQIGTGWQEIYGKYVGALPDNRELWVAPASNNEGQFVAKYYVNNATYWDNNNGMNYAFPQAFDEFAVLTGRNYKVILGNAQMGPSLLDVHVGVQNLGYTKVVGIVFTVDNWATVQRAFGHYTGTMKSGLEVWRITAQFSPAGAASFAIFYQVNGNEYWDNNFWRNYKMTTYTAQQWGITA